jgi:hypothetical protein
VEYSRSRSRLENSAPPTIETRSPTTVRMNSITIIATTRGTMR